MTSCSDVSGLRSSPPLDFGGYLAECRGLVLAEMQASIPARRRTASNLYDLVFDYPMRDAKALRPALCIATCRAFYGSLDAVLPSATVLELYHNAFLIHDDIEDQSEQRRGAATLHRAHGPAVALNVGDTMLALALGPLLENTRVIGLGRALRVLEVIARMARESAEGQALELSWIGSGRFDQTDGEYLRMVHKKTSHYTFVAPVLIGAIVAGAPPHVVLDLCRFAILLGAAFQIQDDVLNLDGDVQSYGKEIAGDLWEGKHTLILLHALRHAADRDRERARRILRKRRPVEAGRDAALDAIREKVGRLVKEGRLEAKDGRELGRLLGSVEPRGVKQGRDIDFLLGLIRKHGSLDHARDVARRRARRAERCLSRACAGLAPSSHREFLFQLTDFVTARQH